MGVIVGVVGWQEQGSNGGRHSVRTCVQVRRACTHVCAEPTVLHTNKAARVPGTHQPKSYAGLRMKL
jgi:hypothetical protein